MSRVFPTVEYHKRLNRLRSVMATRNLDVVIADESEMLHYFTGFAISENLYRRCCYSAGRPANYDRSKT